MGLVGCQRFTALTSSRARDRIRIALDCKEGSHDTADSSDGADDQESYLASTPSPVTPSDTRGRRLNHLQAGSRWVRVC
jgi:hypothetical protein